MVANDLIEVTREMADSLGGDESCVFLFYHALFPLSNLTLIFYTGLI